MHQTKSVLTSNNALLLRCSWVPGCPFVFRRFGGWRGGRHVLFVYENGEGTSTRYSEQLLRISISDCVDLGRTPDTDDKYYKDQLL